MKSIVEEKLVPFKTLEQKVFRYVCELAQEITRILLESYDAELAEGRDKSQYRDKGKRNDYDQDRLRGSKLLPEESTRRIWRMEGRPVCTCWMKPCTWIRSGCSLQTWQKKSP